MTDSNYKSEHNLDTMSKNLALIFIVRNGFACFLVSPFQGLSSQTALEQSKEKNMVINSILLQNYFGRVLKLNCTCVITVQHQT